MHYAVVKPVRLSDISLSTNNLINRLYLQKQLQCHIEEKRRHYLRWILQGCKMRICQNVRQTDGQRFIFICVEIRTLCRPYWTWGAFWCKCRMGRGWLHSEDEIFKLLLLLWLRGALCVPPLTGRYGYLSNTARCVARDLVATNGRIFPHLERKVET